MRKFACILLLLSPMAAFASNPARFDLPVVTTTPAQVPIGSLPDLLAVTNATIAVCGYPATLSNGMCTNRIATYSDSTLSSACPSTAQLTAPGTSVCISTTGLQGAFGFWYDAAVNAHMTYTVQTSWGTFGPYDILPGSSSGGSGTVTNLTAGNLSSLFTTSVSNPTSTPALNFTPSNFAAHSFYGNNTGSTGTPAASLIGVSDWSPNAYVVGSGSAQAQTVILTPAPTALTAGLEVRWLPVAANTAEAPTLNVNGLGARTITKFGTNALVGGDLTTSAVAYAIYDGSRWQLQNPQTATGGIPTGAVLLNPVGAQVITRNANGDNGLYLSNSTTGTSALSSLGFVNDDGTAILGFGSSTYTGNSNALFWINNISAGNELFQTNGGNTIFNSAPNTTQMTVNGNGIILNQITAGTSPVCPNGTGGALTTSGCATLPTSNSLGDTLFATAASSTTYVARTTSKIPVELYGATPYTSEAAAEAGPDDTAKFQNAVTASTFGVVTCQAGMWYHVEGPLNFASSEGLIGTSNQTYGGQCGLVSNNATSHILSAVGTSVSYLSGVTLANLNIRRSVTPTTTAADIYASFSGGMIVQNVLAYDGIYDFYRHATPAFGIGYWTYLQAGWLLNESTGTYYGFYDDSADGNAENSIVTFHSAAACQNLGSGTTSYGQILTGEAINDNVTYDFNTAGCKYGQVVNYTGAGGSFATNDIHFYGSIHDGLGVSCYKVTGLTFATDGFLEINGGHCNSSTSSSPLADIENSYGVSVRGVNFNQHDGFGASHAIYASSDDHLILSNNTISNFGTSTATQTPIEWTGVTHSSATGNTVVANSGNAGNIFWITGNSTYNSIAGNTLSGHSSAGAGIGIDAGSNNNTYYTNAIDTTNLNLGAIIDGGTGNNSLISNTLLSIINTSAAAHVPIATYYAPNATYGSGCLAYSIQGVAATTNNSVQTMFGCIGAGSASNWYGWTFFGSGIYNSQIFPNGSTEFGEATPAVGPANGIAVGSAGNAQIDGSGNISTAAVTAATSGTAVNSPFAKWLGNYWNGTASAVDTWTCNIQFNTAGGFTNPESDLFCGGSGSSGSHIFKVTNASVANLTANVINSYGSPSAIVWGANAITPATSGGNFNSPQVVIDGSIWTGSAGQSDQYFMQDVVGSGANPATALTFTHGTGTTGATSVNFSGLPVTAPSFTTSGSAPKIATGTASNSDVAGQLTLSGGTATYTFANTYTSAPICVATDTTATNAVKVSVSTTVLTLTGTSTDVLNYICIGRN